MKAYSLGLLHEPSQVSVYFSVHFCIDYRVYTEVGVEHCTEYINRKKRTDQG